LYLSVDFYNKRMYAKGCNPGEPVAWIKVRKAGAKPEDWKKIMPYQDNAYVNSASKNWPLGKYEIAVQVDYSQTTQNFVKDFTLRVYHQDNVKLAFSQFSNEVLKSAKHHAKC
jgi:hypothetical protein